MPIINPIDVPEIDFDVSNFDELIAEYIKDLEKYIETFGDDTVKSRSISYAKRFILNKLEEKWQPILGFSKSLIISDIQDLQTPETNFIKSLTIGEAMQHYRSSVGWLVPNILRSAGMYILGGEPKSGKSLFVYFLIHAVAVGAQFLGRPTRLGKVLYIQLEESLNTISERLFLTGFGNLADEDTSLLVNLTDHVQIERSFDATLDINWLMKRITEYKPSLVVIDSLRMATLNSDAEENNNRMGKLVYRLQQVFNYTNTCGLVIHHMNKGSAATNARKDSLITKLAGHTSISSACDGILGLMVDETQTGRDITLKTLPRDGSPVTIQYRMVTNAEGLWELEKFAEDTPLNNSATSKILRFLANHVGQEFDTRTLARELNIDPTTIEFRQSLGYLQGNQLIHSEFRAKKFYYSLPEDSLWLINPQRVRDIVSPAVVDANNLMRCKTKGELRNLIKDWTLKRKRQAGDILVGDEFSRINALTHSWEFAVGEVVEWENELATIVELGENPPTLTEAYYTIKLRDDTIVHGVHERKLKALVIPQDEEPLPEEVGIQLQQLLTFTDEVIDEEEWNPDTDETMLQIEHQLSR